MGQRLGAPDCGIACKRVLPVQRGWPSSTATHHRKSNPNPIQNHRESEAHGSSLRVACPVVMHGYTHIAQSAGQIRATRTFKHRYFCAELLLNDVCRFCQEGFDNGFCQIDWFYTGCNYTCAGCKAAAAPVGPCTHSRPPCRRVCLVYERLFYGCEDDDDALISLLA